MYLNQTVTYFFVSIKPAEKTNEHWIPHSQYGQRRNKDCLKTAPETLVCLCVKNMLNLQKTFLDLTSSFPEDVF